MTCGIYQIVNIINDMVYIGSSYDIESRWSKHKSQLRLKNHPNPYLLNVSNKYGIESFKLEILSTLSFDISDEELRGKEQEVINNVSKDKLYNLCPVAGSTKGRSHSEETKRKISKSLIGHKGSNYFLGKKHSQETKDKIRKSLLGKNVGKEAPEKRIAVIQIDKITGEVLKEFSSIAEVSKFFNCKAHHISTVCRGKRKTALGFKWRYK